MRQVLVTGANGFIGKALMHALRSRGIAALGVDLTGNGRDVLAGDIGAPESLRQVLTRSDCIIHAAALVSNAMDDEAMWRVNVLATQRLISAAIAAGVRRFVHVSSVVVYGNDAQGECDETRPVQGAGGNYVLTKLAAEHAVLAARACGAIETVIVRPGDVYGPGCRVWVEVPLALIRRYQFMLPAMGEGRFRPIYIDDLVDGILRAAMHSGVDGEIFNLSCEGWVPTRIFFAHHHRWLSRRGPLCLPTGIAWPLAEASFRLQRALGVRSEASGASVWQLTSKAWFSPAKAGRLLDWHPVTPLDAGMHLTQRWAHAKGLLR